MSFHPVGASMVESRLPAYQQPSYFGRGIPGMLASRGMGIVGTYPVWTMPDGTRCGPATRFGRCPQGVRLRNASALGQLTMDPQTAAALQACSDKCEKQYGVSSGRPDVIQLSLCFAGCDMQFPPTIGLPGDGSVTPPPVSVPTTPAPTVETQPPLPAPPTTEVTPETPVTKSGITGDSKVWIIGGALALAAAGAFLYFKKK